MKWFCSSLLYRGMIFKENFVRINYSFTKKWNIWITTFKKSLLKHINISSFSSENLREYSKRISIKRSIKHINIGVHYSKHAKLSRYLDINYSGSVKTCPILQLTIHRKSMCNIRIRANAKSRSKNCAHAYGKRFTWVVTGPGGPWGPGDGLDWFPIEAGGLLVGGGAPDSGGSFVSGCPA